MARVFISYRRNDSRWATGRLYDRLAEVLGRENLFFDVSDIEPGEDFVAKIGEIVGRCDILLAVIGPTWLSIQGKNGQRRLEDPEDLIRVEIGAALRRNVRVIPLLVDGAEMPEEGQLPADIASLARRNAREFSFNRFHADVDSFIRVLERVLVSPEAKDQKVQEPSPAQAQAPASAPIATDLPFTISIETVGGVATPLIRKGSDLPATAGEVFSTHEDNQSVVAVQLFAGERPLTQDNVFIGRFELRDIPPAPRGQPQIAIQATVDRALILTVSAQNQATGQQEVLDAVDLTKVELSEEMRGGSATKTTDSLRDSPVDFSSRPQAAGKGFKGAVGDYFAELFGQPKPAREKGAENIFSEIFGAGFGSFKDFAQAKNIDCETNLILSSADAGAGTERTINTGNGKRVKVKIQPGMTSGQVLRLRGLGLQDGSRTGDLYVKIIVKD